MGPCAYEFSAEWKSNTRRRGFNADRGSESEQQSAGIVSCKGFCSFD